MRLFSRASFVAAVLAAISLGQTKAVLGRDNAVFARGLLDAGYDDFAEGVARAMRDTAGGGNVQDENELQALALDIRQLRASRESDVAVRMDLILAVILDKRAFIEENSRTLVAEILRGGLPDAYFIFGDSLAKALKAETDPAKSAALREKGQANFAAAEASLIERIERFRGESENPNADSERAQRQIASSLYNLGVIYYFHSLVYPDGDPEQKTVLSKSRQTFLEFGLDFSGDLLNYRGMVFQGLCHRGLGKDAQALRDFDDAIDLRTTYGDPNNGVYDATPADAVDVVSWAVQEKVRLLSDQGKHDAALEAARDYFATVPEPLSAERGLAVLHARARAEKALGQTDAARASADELIAADPNGTYGVAGRQLLSEMLSSNGSQVGGESIMRIAETLANGGEFGRALDLCRQAREQALGAPDAAAVGAQSYMVQGQIYDRQKRLAEAAIAFDLVAELYPSSDFAGDGLWNAVLTYGDLGRTDRGLFYSKRVKERMIALATRYPNHSKAAYAQIVEARQLESGGEWQKAVDLYQRVKSGSAGYEESQLGAGTALFRLAQKFAAEGKENDATATYLRAEEQLRAAIVVLDKAAADTLDRAVQVQFESFAFQARGMLGNLLLERGKPEEVEALFADAETRYASDPSKLGKVWSLRIQARLLRGKLDEAVQLLDSLLAKDPNSLGVAGAAGVVARALDQAGVDEFEKDPASDKVAPLWRKAAHYYGINIRPQLDGREALNGDNVLVIAQRLVTMGFNFNGVPLNAASFVDWHGGDGKSKPTEPEVWERAVEIFRLLLERAPSTPATIQMARALGLLARYDEANKIYAELFDRQRLFTNAGQLDANVLRVNPELLDAYLEWGVTEHHDGKAEKDNKRLERAGGIFDRMVKSTESGEQRWWRAKYFQAASLNDRGQYNDAKFVLSDVKRTQSQEFDGGRFGWKERFVALEQEVDRKVRK